MVSQSRAWTTSMSTGRRGREEEKETEKEEEEEEEEEESLFRADAVN